jgi:primosomal protein N' (replication factor Y)
VSRCRRGSAASTCRRSRRSISSAKDRSGDASSRPASRKRSRIAIERKEQALLFLNRRGYAPLTLCRACGHRFACTICDAWLVDHRFRQRLVCHHCGFSMPRPHQCPHCGAEESLAAIGPGVERLQEEAAVFSPRRARWCCRAIITDIETMRRIERDRGRPRRHHHRHAARGKGHNFPRLNLVGVVDADLGLGNGDPRAAERTFQLLNQVIGRAGRGRDAVLAICKRISLNIR